jgi:hypothetical protein
MVGMKSKVCCCSVPELLEKCIGVCKNEHKNQYCASDSELKKNWNDHSATLDHKL